MSQQQPHFRSCLKLLDGTMREAGSMVAPGILVARFEAA